MASVFSQNEATNSARLEARLGNTTPGKIELAEIQSQEGLRIVISDSDASGNMSVKSYEITMISSGVDPTSTVNKGGEFSIETQEQLKRLKVGDTVYFDSILVEIPGENKDTKLASLVFKVI